MKLVYAAKQCSTLPPATTCSATNAIYTKIPASISNINNIFFGKLLPQHLTMSQRISLKPDKLQGNKCTFNISDPTHLVAINLKLHVNHTEFNFKMSCSSRVRFANTRRARKQQHTPPTSYS